MVCDLPERLAAATKEVPHMGFKNSGSRIYRCGLKGLSLQALCSFLPEVHVHVRIAEVLWAWELEGRDA